MRPIFTIHAGEYLVANYIEQHYGTLSSTMVRHKVFAWGCPQKMMVLICLLQVKIAKGLSRYRTNSQRVI